MPKKTLRKRINRPATAAERKRHQQIREQIEKEKPELTELGRKIKAEHVRLKETLKALRETRQAMGITLDELAERSGIAKPNLSRLENNPNPNPTIETLNRYAEALGKELLITIAD